MTSHVIYIVNDSVLQGEGHRTFRSRRKVPSWEPFRFQAEKRLRILDAAVTLADLAALNSNRLESLKGDRKGQYSIRINEQWRICFEWPKDSAGPENVEIVDYH